MLIGSRFSNYLLPDQIGSLEIEPALHSLSKGRASNQPEIQILLSVLESLALLDFQTTEINYRYREEESRDIATSIRRSVAQEGFLNRIKIESDGIARAPQVRDGGTRKVLERRDFAIEIHGSGRIAFSLLGALIASGFDLAQIVNGGEIGPMDAIGNCINRKDIGLNAKIKNEELLNDSSLYPEPLQISKRADLIISIGSPFPEVLQTWNRERIPQLFLDFDNPGEIRIGPQIVPGMGACYNCVNIAENEGGRPLLDSLSRALRPSQEREISQIKNLEVTTALATFSAGVVALLTTQIAATGKSDLFQKSALYSTLKFLEPKITSWEQSPRCGCNWI